MCRSVLVRTCSRAAVRTATSPSRRVVTDDARVMISVMTTMILNAQPIAGGRPIGIARAAHVRRRAAVLPCCAAAAIPRRRRPRTPRRRPRRPPAPPPPANPNGPRIYVSDETGRDVVVIDPGRRAGGRADRGRQAAARPAPDAGRQAADDRAVGIADRRPRRRRIEAAAGRSRRRRHRRRRRRQRKAGPQVQQRPGSRILRHLAGRQVPLRVERGCRRDVGARPRVRRPSPPASRSARSPKASPCGPTAGSST